MLQSFSTRPYRKFLPYPKPRLSSPGPPEADAGAAASASAARTASTIGGSRTPIIVPALSEPFCQVTNCHLADTARARDVLVTRHCRNWHGAGMLTSPL